MPFLCSDDVVGIGLRFDVLLHLLLGNLLGQHGCNVVHLMRIRSRLSPRLPLCLWLLCQQQKRRYVLQPGDGRYLPCVFPFPYPHEPPRLTLPPAVTANTIAASGKLRRVRRDGPCDDPKLTRCPIPGLEGTSECVDTKENVESCGGCVGAGGVDCTTIQGVSGVECNAGVCVIRTSLPLIRYAC